jgi:hypothetical protein
MRDWMAVDAISVIRSITVLQQPATGVEFVNTCNVQDTRRNPSASRGFESLL